MRGWTGMENSTANRKPLRQVVLSHKKLVMGHLQCLRAQIRVGLSPRLEKSQVPSTVYLL
ncbi:hypothetical protein E2C01_034017 [Portunus trituberculatus]|uniref:Uncharacterized protein n=1 Tax=Portunus trituberculatus TaxID=210409 RepID=A0A5B7F597_PORTR|nr:hypothetical protein [Portunus trituberculatus]